MSAYLLTVFASLCGLSIVTRVLPFVLGQHLAKSPRVRYVGKKLPAYIMLLLVIYEIDPGTFAHWPYAIPALLSVAVVILMQVRCRQVLLSLVVGAGAYIALLKLFTT